MSKLSWIEREKDYHREYYRKRKKDPVYLEAYRNYQKEYYKKNRLRKAEFFREKNRKYRVGLIEFMGGRCVTCGFSDWRALQVDHKKGGGSKENRERKRMLNTLELREEINKFPLKYQLLCANCNWIKRYENRELQKIK